MSACSTAPGALDAGVPRFSHPVDASELPNPGGGVRVLSLNLANGAGDAFRTAATREKQAALLREARVAVAAFQEVDVGTIRSGQVNSALDVVRRLGGDYSRCDEADAGQVTPLADGTWRCAADGGTVVFGEGFAGDSLFASGDSGVPVGIDDGDDALNPTGTDTSPRARFGNAAWVDARWSVVEAFTYSLPPDVNASAWRDDALVAAVTGEALAPAARAALGARHARIRDAPGIEPRAALIVRVSRPGRPLLSVVTTHLEAGPDAAALRAVQLETVARLAVAERAGPPARELVVLGDFNQSPIEVGAFLGDAGFRLEAGEPDAGIENVDQVWVDAMLQTEAGAQVRTHGASDHPHAACTTLR